MLEYEALYILFISSVLHFIKSVNTLVPAPYMDEIFHIPQAQTYCKGDWYNWDEMITTPPGLYLPNAILSRLIPQISPWVCSVTGLRAFNALLLLLLPLICTSILSILYPSSTAQSKFSHQLSGIAIACFPLVYFFGGLFYTDVGGLILVLLSYRAGLKGQYFLSSLAGASSLWFRQTNILWLGFIAGSCVIRKLSQTSISATQRLHDSKLCQVSFSNVISSPMSLILAILSKISSLLSILFAYVPVFALSLAFVIWNGGIVLGDKSNHIPTVHLTQLFYFIGFSATFLTPVLFSVSTVRATLLSCIKTPLRVASSIMSIAVICYCIKHYTITHPFLLSDNRHYPFYFYSRIINFTPYTRYLLSVPYLLGFKLIWNRLVASDSTTLLQFLFYSIAILGTLIPSPLIEFRYFIIPFVLLRLHLQPIQNSSNRVILEIIFFSLINFISIYAFLYRTFSWVGHEGLQRFMW